MAEVRSIIVGSDLIVSANEPHMTQTLLGSSLGDVFVFLAALLLSLLLLRTGPLLLLLCKSHCTIHHPRLIRVQIVTSVLAATMKPASMSSNGRYVFVEFNVVSLC